MQQDPTGMSRTNVSQDHAIMSSPFCLCHDAIATYLLSFFSFSVLLFMTDLFNINLYLYGNKQTNANTLGQVLLLENSRSSNPLLARYQDATSTAAAEMGGKGCVYNQDVESMIAQSTKRKMVVEKQERYAAGLFRAFRCTVAE